MQTRGTFPELNSGMSKKKSHRRNSGTFASAEKGMAGFMVKRAPRMMKNARSFSGRRDAAHRKAHGE